MPFPVNDALRRLRDGNARFLAGHSHVQTLSPTDFAKQSMGQEPYATIIGCADSRVAPEIIFDAVMGELFVIRVAGNVMSSEIAGSLQYAAQQLRTPFFLVLGHTGCGAVKAALEYHFRGAKQQSRIQVLVDSIMPAIESIDAELAPPRQLEAAIEANVRWTIQQIAESEARPRFETGEFVIDGAVYDIATGHVRFLSDDA